MLADRMGDEAGVPVGYKGCGWSWGRVDVAEPVGFVWLVCASVGFGECDRALVSSLSLSPLTLTWFPTNVACNSHVNLLNIEVESLE